MAVAVSATELFRFAELSKRAGISRVEFVNLQNHNNLPFERSPEHSGWGWYSNDDVALICTAKRLAKHLEISLPQACRIVRKDRKLAEKIDQLCSFDVSWVF